jgi:hypothetical protein
MNPTCGAALTPTDNRTSGWTRTNDLARYECAALPLSYGGLLTTWTVKDLNLLAPRGTLAMGAR